MGAYCTLDYIRRHPAKMGEILEVRRSYPDYHYVAVFGDNKEIACIPHRGCSLEIVAVPGTSHGEVNLLLPGQVLRYTRSFFFGDRLELPSGKKVGFDQLVGFKLQLAPRMAAAPPDGDHREECPGRQAGRRHGRRLAYQRNRAARKESCGRTLASVSVPCPWRERRLHGAPRDEVRLAYGRPGAEEGSNEKACGVPGVTSGQDKKTRHAGTIA